LQIWSYVTVWIRVGDHIVCCFQGFADEIVPHHAGPQPRSRVVH